MKNLFLILILWTTIACNQSASSVYIQEDSLEYYQSVSRNQFMQLCRDVSSHFEKTLLNPGFYGQVLIAKNGEVVFENVSGYSDPQENDSLRYESSMHLASAGKPFTAMAVLQLAEKGKLNLGDSLTRFFPAFPYEGVTIQMLLSHRSGLPNYLYFLSAVKKQDTCYTNQDVLNALYTLKPPADRSPGRGFGYSNTNYVLLALIIEKITGRSFPEYLEENIFEPLGMRHTFVYTGQTYNRITPTFDGYGKRWREDQFDCTYGDKNLYSTARDMFTWMTALENGSIISRQMLDSAFTPLSNERPSMHNYGLGWRMINFPGERKIIYHNGRWHGTNSVFAWLPEEKVTVIILGNKFNRNIYTAARKAYDFFGAYYNKNDDSTNTDLEESP